MKIKRHPREAEHASNDLCKSISCNRINANDGSGLAPRLCVFGNRWGLRELPRLPREEEWSFESILDRLVANGFTGVQATSAEREVILRHGLRYCVAGRVNEPIEIEPLLKRSAD